MLICKLPPVIIKPTTPEPAPPLSVLLPIIAVLAVEILLKSVTKLLACAEVSGFILVSPSVNEPLVA